MKILSDTLATFRPLDRAGIAFLRKLSGTHAHGGVHCVVNEVDLYSTHFNSVARFLCCGAEQNQAGILREA